MSRITVEEFNKICDQAVLIYDGAMGTNLQTQNLKAEDFGGKQGCSEALNLYCPQAVKKVHLDFINVGCRVIETNTFGATFAPLSEYGLGDQVAQINQRAVEIAREAITESDTTERILIAGSIGPGSRLPSLGHVTFDDLAQAYHEQMLALWDAEVDILQIETCQDLLQVKSALYAAQKLFAEKNDRCPVVVSVTLEPNGTMLVGTDMAAITAALQPFDFIDILSINCATGPLEMVRHVAHLAEYWPGKIGVMPNAGLPENVDGKPVYKMTPHEFATFQQKFVEDYAVNMVGGCCGTTPAHLAEVVSRLRSVVPARQNRTADARVASLFSAVSLRQNPAPTLVAERTNANGAKRFKELLEAEDWDGMTSMGREQARGGAHLIDLCVAYAGRNEVEDLKKLVPMFATQVNLPLVIDSTSPEAIETALKRHGGRCVINSVNLEDGGHRLGQIAQLARTFGAALICLTIDENGMAKSADDKLKVARRMHKLLTEEYGFAQSSLIFDALTFTVGSGDSELRNAAAETLKAIKLICSEFPEANTILGVSNVSFGLAVEARELLNSVFLQEAVAAGLSAAIVNPARIIPAFSIRPDERALALDLIYNARGDGSELKAYMAAFTSERPFKQAEEESLPPDQKLFARVVDGDLSGIEDLLNTVLKDRAPEEIINHILLPAMEKVGEFFGNGQLQLPFVLQSAEVVKKSVNFLEPLMPKKPVDPQRSIVLATVAGDVHDIGKNLVAIMLANNGYNVIDIGIKVDIDAMIKAAEKNSVRIIGMSGLLVRSTQIMKENLEELNRRDFLPAVILGGAALTKTFVEKELCPVYKGKVYYAKDAVDSIKIMQQIVAGNSAQKPVSESAEPTQPHAVPDTQAIGAANRHQFNTGIVDVQAPFYASHLLEISSTELFSLLSHKVLFEGRWGFRKDKLSEAQYQNIIETKAKPALYELIELDRANEIFQPRAVYGYFKCRSAGDCIKVFDLDGFLVGEFEFPRQMRSPYLCLSDFVAHDRDDLIAFWLVTVGDKVDKEQQKQLAADSYSNYFLLHGLGAELADCAAVHVHRHIHRELFPLKPLTDIKPQGCRYSFGYPACPDLGAQKELFRILDAERIGVRLTELDQMVPELSVSGFILFNSHARYFVP